MDQTRLEQIARVLGVFLLPGQVVELMALGIGNRRAVNRFFRGEQLEDMAAQALRWEVEGAASVRFVPNPLRPDAAQSRRFVKNEDVIARCLVMIDCEAKEHASGESATQEERDAAWAVWDRCRGTLEAFGVGGIAVADSGNGWHGFDFVDLPNDEASKLLVKTLLKGLSERCSDEHAHVDPDTYQAVQLCKVYGTVTRKGTHTPERPHRYTRLVEGSAPTAELAAANTAAIQRLLEHWSRQEDARKGPRRESLGEAQREAARMSLYAEAALRKTVGEMASALPGRDNPHGGRNRQLFKAAAAMGELIAAGGLARLSVEAQLEEASLVAGLPLAEARDAIRSGIEKGLLSPRSLPETNGHHAGNGYHQAEATRQEEPRPSDAPGAPPPTPAPVAVLRRVSDVERRRVSWLMKNWLPRGELSILDGDPGLGKSSLTLDWAARVSRGWKMPPAGGPDPERRPAGVLLLSAEDDVGCTIRPRLEEMGADLDRVHIFDAVREGTTERPPVLPWDLDLVEATARELDVALVVADPFAAYLASEFDAHKDQDVRRCLHQLSLFARRLSCVFLLIRHLNKLNGGAALYRGGGSIGITGHARASLIVGRDPGPGSEGIRVLAMNKINIGPNPKSLAYRLEPSAAGDVCKLAWLGETDLGPSDILWHDTTGQRGAGRPDDAMKEARDLLVTMLSGAPALVSDIRAEAEHAGIGWRTIEKAKAEMHIDAHKTGAVWTWSLPKGSPH